MADKLTLKALSGELEALRKQFRDLELGVGHKIERGINKIVVRFKSQLAGQEGRASPLLVNGDEIADDERRKLIAETAYLYSERRGFAHGNPEQDWLRAEKEIDQLLSQGGTQAMLRRDTGAGSQSQQGH